VLQRQAELAARRDDLAGMQRHALESLSVASTLGTPDALWRADFLLARTLWLQGEPDLAVLFGKRALDSIQALRRSLVGAAARLEPRFVERRTDVYRTVADWLMAAGRYDEALEVLALLKFAEREEFLVRAEQPAAAPGPLSRTERERTLEERIAGVIGEETDAQLDVLSQLRLADRITPTERARLERMIDAGRAAEAARLVALESFIAEARAEAPAAANRSRIVEAGRLDRELRRFGDEAVLAIYLLTEDRLRILVATRERSIEHDVRIPAAELRREIGLFLDDLAARRDVEARARQLHEWLLRPVDQAAREAGARRLILWPDGALRYVPFAALHDGRSHAVDRYDIQLFAETSVTSTAVPGRREAFAVRGLGVTHAVGGYAALPAVADELCSIVRGPIAGLETPGARCRRAATGEPLTGAGALRGEGYADERFTREQLESLLAASGDFGVLHMGTHFSLRPGNALRSFLLLGDGTRYTLDRLAALDLSGIRLMTLSACQTALGGAVTDDGREVEGLSALVQQRGVDRVVASLWRVEDRSTALLMQRFYDRLSGPRAGGAHALRRAQLDVRRHVESGKRPYEHPFYWAGFTLSAASF
jgi:CHAT domain-containing protein